MPLFVEGNSIMRTSQWLRMAPLVLVSGCSTLMTGEDAIPILSPKLVGRHAADLIAMYGQPSLVQVQYGHDVYYWERSHAFVYTPQYSATTQGNIGNTPFNATTTVAGDPEVGTAGCILVAGARVGTDVIERIDVRGIECDSFMR